MESSTRAHNAYHRNGCHVKRRSRVLMDPQTPELVTVPIVLAVAVQYPPSPSLHTTPCVARVTLTRLAVDATPVFSFSSGGAHHLQFAVLCSIKLALAPAWC
jgi:hypothetical protein